MHGSPDSLAVPAPKRGWDGVACDVAVANFGETFGLASLAGHGWTKAALVPAMAGYALVVPKALVQPAPWEQDMAHAPGGVIVPEPRHGAVTWDLLADQRAWGTLLGLLRNRPIADAPVRLWAQVHSAGVEEIVRQLVDSGLPVDDEALPVVSGGTVGHWNSKLGGRELLSSAAELRPHLPAATVATALPEVVAIVASDPGRGFVVKPDRSLGGTGMTVFPPDPERTLASTIASLEAANEIGPGTTKAKAGGKVLSYADVSGPFLIEELVGTPATNLSPTVDVLVDRTAAPRTVGVALQRLVRGTTYCGASSVPASLEAASRRWQKLACDVGRVLACRGYAGLCNVDLIHTADGRLWIAEINLRQSAPLDGTLIMRRLAGDGWPSTRALYSIEALAATHERVIAEACRLGWGDPRDPDGFAAIAVAQSTATTGVVLTGALGSDLEEEAATLRQAVDA